MSSITKAKIATIHQELKSLGTLSVPDDYKFYLVKGVPLFSLGFHGSFAQDALNGNLYWKNGTRWVLVHSLLETKTTEKSIYRRTLKTPAKPSGNVNIGWADQLPDAKNLINAHIWESRARFIGSVRISDWSVPSVRIKGDISVREILTEHTIYLASKFKPPIKSRVDDPTKDSPWSSVYPGKPLEKDVVIWVSSTIKNQHGQIKRPWSVPKADAKDGKKVVLEYKDNMLYQKYEGETSNSQVASREEIIGKITSDDLENFVITNEKLAPQSIEEINIKNGEINAKKLNLDIHLLN